MVDDNLLETDRKRYADDVTVQELVRLRVENERLRAENRLLQKDNRNLRINVGYAADLIKSGFPNDAFGALEEVYAATLQQKDSE